jgi:hypothetical protein
LLITGLFPGPMDETPLNQQEHEIETIAERAGGKNRRVHAWHVEQLLRLEYTVAEPVLRADEQLVPAELLAQLDFRPLERAALARGQFLAGAIDVENQHRQRRTIGLGLAPMALLGRALERGSDALGVSQLEHAAFQIKGVAFAGNAARPVAARNAPCRWCVV